ncbi:MAG: LamG domain-containing protein [Actinomycetota bacterium]
MHRARRVARAYTHGLLACLALMAALAFPATGAPGSPSAGSLRFSGSATGKGDFVRVAVHDPTKTSDPPINVGAAELTIEWMMRASTAETAEEAVPCGANEDWMLGNTIVDRRRLSKGRTFGASVAGGMMVFGVTGASNSSRSICGTRTVTDGRWHHVAVQFRASDGAMWIWVDGSNDARGTGPATDISYPSNAVLPATCPDPPCTTDLYMYFGSSKLYRDPAYRGQLSEVRVSDSIRYTSAFAPKRAPFSPDGHTVALFHLDDGNGSMVHDSSHAPGATDAERVPDSSGNPAWSEQGPFSSATPDSVSPSHPPSASASAPPQGSEHPAGASVAQPTFSGGAAPKPGEANAPVLSAQAAGDPPRRVRQTTPLALSPVVPPLFIALIGLGIAIAIASRFLRESRL